jgi:2-dehydro-3-deoxyphosphogluconate aldolase/(4S)-4-hydroxy-2-oxoglutarate aldolase
MPVLSQILEHKIIAILRGANPSDVLKIASALYDGGVRILEVTFNSPAAMEVVQELAVKMGDKMLVGMGTVLDAATARHAIERGAAFIVSPSFDSETINETKKYGAISIPGAFTPTEIVNAFNCGGDIIKVFPASGNVNYIREIRAPLSHVPLMPTGGINLENIGEFLNTGVVAFGIGTALVNTKEKITEESLEKVKVMAELFTKAVRS